jgi:ABC-2 type transport system ATP-binding protein
MTEVAIQTHALRKAYGRTIAVEDLSLTVRRGEVFGFLGPNGAGKTTSLKMLLDLVHPSGGTGEVLGRPLGDRATRARIGLLPEHFHFHESLTGTEILYFHGRLYGLRGTELRTRIDELLARVGLIDAAERAVREYSKGMAQRLGLAQALLNRPALIFLDEPTSGLDPLGRMMVRDVIRAARDEGATVFLNSHLLGEVESICERVAFVRSGKVVRELVLGGDAESLRVELRIDRAADVLAHELARFGSDVAIDGCCFSLQVEREETIPELVRWLTARNIGLFSLQSRRRSLEELFVETIGDTHGPG